MMRPDFGARIVGTSIRPVSSTTWATATSTKRLEEMSGPIDFAPNSAAVAAAAVSS